MLRTEVKQQKRKPKLIIAGGVPVDTKAEIIASTEEVIERHSGEGVSVHECKRNQAN